MRRNLPSEYLVQNANLAGRTCFEPGLADMPRDTPMVFIVDDDISVREALNALIRLEGWQAETFASAGAFLAHHPPPVPSCLILDINLPDLSGLDLQERIAFGQNNRPIIFITGHGDIPMTVRAMKAGAAEFLTKPFSDRALLEAVRQALERSRMAIKRMQELHELRESYATLSRREQEVMERVVSGLLNKQIAYDLGISEITVKAHRGKVMRKMKAKSLPDLVNIAALLDIRA